MNCYLRLEIFTLTLKKKGDFLNVLYPFEKLEFFTKTMVRFFQKGNFKFSPRFLTLKLFFN